MTHLYDLWSNYEAIKQYYFCDTKPWIYETPLHVLDWWPYCTCVTWLVRLLWHTNFSTSDTTLTTNNVSEVMELVSNWGPLQYATYTEPEIIPSDRFSAIEEKCSTKRETASECASYYVQCHPLASWTHLADRLYLYGEFTAVKRLKPYLPLRGNTNTIY